MNFGSIRGFPSGPAIQEQGPVVNPYKTCYNESMTFVSKIDPNITEKYLLNAKESLYFERKGIKAKRGKIANEIVGMLNADGGVLVVGVEDDGSVSGLDNISSTEMEKYKKLCQDMITPTPHVKTELAMINNSKVIIYHVLENNENVFAKKDSNEVYKRVGDSNYGPLTINEIDNLRYDKNLRSFEDQFVEDFDIDDFDYRLMEEYKNNLRFDGSYDDLLINRNLAKITKDGIRYKNSAILLFSKDPDKYIPSAYVRYVKYDGSFEGSGMSYNVVKDERIMGNIPTVIRKTSEFLKASFGDYYYFDTNTGLFKRIPEYPEDAWLEGVVNAVFHRSYNLQGNCILIKHFDNSLEISNSGPLPAQVNVKNIKEQRFSRNPRIGRVLYEMGFVRELNEGVKRIYSSMDEYRLDEPYYTDENDIVTLKLVNASYGNDKNISRDVLEKIAKNYKEYNATKKAIIDRLLFRGDCTLDEIEKANKSGLRAIQNNIKDLIDDGIVVRYSEKIRDKNAIYGITKPLSEHYKNGSNRG